jgi:hypothetical protein
MNCKICQTALPDLLLDPAAPGNAEARAHLAECAACAAEFVELKATFALLDEWQAPEISPYFDQKLAVLLREEQSAPPAGFFERLKDRLLFNTGRQFRPTLVGSLALLLIAGGGGVGISTLTTSSRHPVAESATVNDLQILDKNEQALQQVDQLLQDDGQSDDDSAPPS